MNNVFLSQKIQSEISSYFCPSTIGNYKNKETVSKIYSLKPWLNSSWDMIYIFICSIDSIFAIYINLSFLFLNNIRITLISGIGFFYHKTFSYSRENKWLS